MKAEYITLDTNIYLGMTFANDGDCLRLFDEMMLQNSKYHVIICSSIIDEVTRNLTKVHFGISVFQNLVLGQLSKNGKLLIGNGIKSLNEGCLVNDPDDEHLVKCALSKGEGSIITKDSKLIVSKECKVKKIMLEDFIKSL